MMALPTAPSPVAMYDELKVARVTKQRLVLPWNLTKALSLALFVIVPRLLYVAERSLRLRCVTPPLIVMLEPAPTAAKRPLVCNRSEGQAPMRIGLLTVMTTDRSVSAVP